MNVGQNVMSRDQRQYRTYGSIKDNGPVPDFTSKDITCNVGGNIAAKKVIPVVPGDKVYGLPDFYLNIVH